MSNDQSVSKNTPGSPWFSTPDAVPAKNLKEIELSLSSISDSSSLKRRRLRFLASNYTNRDPGEESNEVNGSTIPSLQQGLELFPGDQEHDEEQSSSQEVPPLYTTLSRETSSEIELMRQSHPKNYSRANPNTSTRKFFAREVTPEPLTSQIREPPEKIHKKRFAEGSLYSLHMPLGWMAVHGIDEEIWEELPQGYP
ncbi:uncharacterized protein LOC123262492 [Cotesia glomerata]|uniref:uncharacterized protein LOC123262492 n=1 Tax=Cotesia glomerata TaxID=32391 RepID=UPI001D018C6C|nr:uncharacterized protein LOC123262492 [Cotesia glomerata]XP_044580670.1 uncharacterized protein LOC123262492 [Cotesia glomerata]